jgi:hypothetical protein
MTKFPHSGLEHTIKEAVEEHGLLKVVVSLIEMCYYMRDRGFNGRSVAWDDAAHWLTTIEEMLDRVKLANR